MSRMFKLMGMMPVGYYGMLFSFIQPLSSSPLTILIDLTVAALPMHACAFRPLEGPDLLFNPFRIFCSLIRPDLLQPEVRHTAQKLLESRQIMSDSMQQLVAKCEASGGVKEEDVDKCLFSVASGRSL